MTTSHPVNGATYRWEGDVVIDRGVHTRGVIAWEYVQPPEHKLFGAYQLLLHANGNVFMFPAVPTEPGDYRKFVLKRTK